MGLQFLLSVCQWLLQLDYFHGPFWQWIFSIIGLGILSCSRPAQLLQVFVPFPLCPQRFLLFSDENNICKKIIAWSLGYALNECGTILFFQKIFCLSLMSHIFLMGYISGFLCPVHTPDGAPCGLLNHMAASCKVNNDRETVMDREKFIIL